MLNDKREGEATWKAMPYRLGLSREPPREVLNNGLDSPILLDEIMMVMNRFQNV